MNVNAPCNKWAGGAGSKPCPRCGTTISSNKRTCFFCSALNAQDEIERATAGLAHLPDVDAITATIDSRIASVEAQIAACTRGATNVITCPFCSAQNKAENEALCCPDFGAVVRVILRKQAQQECLDTAARIADAVARS